MQWVSVKDYLPTATGAYIVSIKKEGASGAWLFEYVAWFYAPGKKWLQYDPFTEKVLSTYKSDITNIVVGWLNNVPTFFG
jgi:hypothetical protein